MVEYKFVALYLCLCAVIALLVFVLSFFLVFQSGDSEKNSAYECGFAPFGDARSKFEVRFYLVAILFIVFDLEILFLFPWTISLAYLGVYGFVSMVIFLVILTIGFVYEWFKGALDWDFA